MKEVFPECESALVFLFDYTSAKKEQLSASPDFKIASYVTGFGDEDYHYWIKDKLTVIGEHLRSFDSSLDYRFSLDVHPVLERDLAFRSGLGWFGKNSMLISKSHGSYTLIGSLLLNKKFKDFEKKNIYNNLSTLPTIGNDILQTNFHQAVMDTSRFLINSTLGIFGLFDIATMVGIPNNAEDMGLTFARWGWGSSTFVVLPFFGPSTIRDALGRPIDYYMTVYPYMNNVRYRNSLYAMGVVNTRANLLELQGVISQAALDPYVFERNAYLQRRNYLIQRNADLDEIGPKTWCCKLHLMHWVGFHDYYFYIIHIARKQLP